MRSNTVKNNLIPYPVIVLASKGDIDAINTILQHYANYIAALATRQIYNENGNAYLCIDEYLRHRLEIKLITKILTFNAV